MNKKNSSTKAKIATPLIGTSYAKYVPIILSDTHTLFFIFPKREREAKLFFEFEFEK